LMAVADFSSLGLFPPGRGNLGVDLPYRQLVSAPALRGRLDVFQPLRGRGHGVHVVFDAHDDATRLAAAATSYLTMRSYSA